MIGTGLNTAMIYVFGFSPLLAGIILGGLWQVFVLFGIHGVLTVVAFTGSASGNPSQILAFSYGASFATCGVVLAILLKTKSRKLKDWHFPPFISAIFGVTEPATYGITMPRKKMFALLCGRRSQRCGSSPGESVHGDLCGNGHYRSSRLYQSGSSQFRRYCSDGCLFPLWSLSLLVWLCIKILILRSECGAGRRKQGFSGEKRKQ